MILSAEPLIAFRNLLLMLTAATWLIGLLDIQYKSEQKLGFDSHFPGEPSQWKKQGDPMHTAINESSVALQSPSNEKSGTYRVFPLPPPSERLDHTIRVRGVIDVLKQPDPLPVAKEAAYMIWFLDSTDNSFAYITVQSLGGHKKQYRAEKIVEIPLNAHTFALALISRESNGHFNLTEATASLVTLTGAYSISRPLVFASWGLCFLIIGEWLLRQSDKVLTISLTGLLATTLLGILLPLSITTGVVEPAFDKLQSWVKVGDKQTLALMYKVGHFVFFFIISLLLFLRRKAIGLGWALTFQFLIIFVFITEGLQLHLFSRTTKVMDMVIDIGGIAAGWLVATMKDTVSRDN